MVAANKGAVLASDAWSQLNPEQEHALKRALNDAADGVWVLCIVLHFTKTNQADVVFEDLSSSAVATADAEVTTVHPRGDGAGPVADVELSMLTHARGDEEEHRDDRGSATDFEALHSTALQEAEVEAVQSVCKANGTKARPSGGLLLNEEDLETILLAHAVTISQEERVEAKEAEEIQGGQADELVATRSEDQGGPTKRQLMLRAAEKRQAQRQRESDEQAKIAAAQAKASNQGTSESGAGGEDEAEPSQRLLLIPCGDCQDDSDGALGLLGQALVDGVRAMLHSDSSSCVGNSKERMWRVSSSVSVRKLRSIMKHIQQCALQKRGAGAAGSSSEEASLAGCVEWSWDATTTYSFLEQLRVPADLIETVEGHRQRYHGRGGREDAKVRDSASTAGSIADAHDAVDGGWLLNLATALTDDTPTGADAKLFAPQFALVRQRLLFHSLLLTHMHRWFRSMCVDAHSTDKRSTLSCASLPALGCLYRLMIEAEMGRPSQPHVNPACEEDDGASRKGTATMQEPLVGRHEIANVNDDIGGEGVGSTGRMSGDEEDAVLDALFKAPSVSAHTSSSFAFRPPPMPQLSFSDNDTASGSDSDGGEDDAGVAVEAARSFKSAAARAVMGMRAEYGQWLEHQQRTMVSELQKEARARAQMLDELDSECCPLCLFPLHAQAADSGADAGARGAMDPDALVVTTSCRHCFHLGCLRKSRSLSTQGDNCPMCRQPLASGLTPKGREKWAHSLSFSRSDSRARARVRSHAQARVRRSRSNNWRQHHRPLSSTTTAAQPPQPQRLQPRPATYLQPRTFDVGALLDST